MEGGDSPPLFSSHETPAGVVCLGLGSTAEKDIYLLEYLVTKHQTARSTSQGLQNQLHFLN